jgi:hypothetical protein
MTTDSGKNGAGKTDSRLAKHLQVLGLENGGFTDKELSAERKGMAAMQPPPLELGDLPVQRQQPPVRALRGSWYGIGAIAAAAMLAVMVYVQREDDGYRVKGATQVVVYTETAGSVQVWDKKSPLASGVRVRVEFKALGDVVAFVGVKDGKDHDLFSPEIVWTQRLTLSAGQVAAAGGSIELTGPAEGETLVAVTCPAATAPVSLGEFTLFWAASGKNSRQCVTERLRLR